MQIVNMFKQSWGKQHIYLSCSYFPQSAGLDGHEVRLSTAAFMSFYNLAAPWYLP